MSNRNCYENEIRLIGCYFYEKRNKKKYSLNKMACFMDITTSQHLSKVEKGTTNPTFKTMLDICNALDIKLKDVFKELNI